MKTPYRIELMNDAILQASRSIMRDYHEISNITDRNSIRQFLIKSQKQAYSTLNNYMYKNKNVFPSDFTWLFIPIDSLANFVSTIPFFTSIMVLIRDNEINAVTIYSPFLKETIWAVNKEDTNCYITDSITTKKGTCKTNRHNFVILTEDKPEILKIVPKKIIGEDVITRIFGSIGCEIILLLSGKCEGIITSSNKDKKTQILYKALELLVLSGKGKFFMNDNICVMSNQQIYNPTIQHIKKYN